MSQEKSTGPVVVTSLLIGMGLFGTATPLNKIVGDNFSVFTASFLRVTIASLVLAPIVFAFSDRFRNAQRSDYITILMIAAVGMVGFTATMLYGMRMTTGVIGSTIMSATPAVTAMAAVMFLGAAMNWRKGGALGLAVLGVVLINVLRDREGDGGDAMLLGAGLVAVAVCFEAAFTLLSRRLSEGITSMEATLGASLIAAPLFVVLAFLFDSRPFDFSEASAGGWAALLCWSVGAGGLAPVIWYWGVRQAPGALAAGAMAIMPLTALLLSYWLLGETFRWVHVLGFGLVFAGLLLMIVEHAKSEE